MGLVLSLVLGVVGLFEGLQEETEERIGDFFTGDLRVTAGRPGAAPSTVFPFTDEGDLVAAAEALGGDVVGHMESQFVLSRRSLLDAYLLEDEQYEVTLPGGDPETSDFYSVGVLVGVDTGDAEALRPLRPHLELGSFPRYDPDDELVPLLMSQERLASFLSPQEKASLSGWPPAPSELAAFRFEITAARVDPDSPFKDIIRHPAVVTGLYATDLDALDSFVLVAPIQDVRALLGHDPDGPVYNALLVEGDRHQAAKGAAAQGWQSEGSGAFAERYAGELLSAVQWLSVLVAALFLGLPVFLLWHGLAQLLDKQRRQFAVCHAIGIPPGAITSALARLSVLVLAGALMVAAALALLLAAFAPAALGSWGASPLPLGFHLPWWAWVIAVGAAVLGTLFALAAVNRAHRRLVLSEELRAA